MPVLVAAETRCSVRSKKGHISRVILRFGSTYVGLIERLLLKIVFLLIDYKPRHVLRERQIFT